MKKFAQTGMVLVMCLLFSCIISLLVCANLQNNLLNLKTINHYQQSCKVFYSADLTLHHLIAGFNPIKSSCISGTIDVNDAANFLAHKNESVCHYNHHEIDIRYFVEDLGALPCSVAVSNHIPTHRYRMNLLAQQHEYKIQLQTVFIIADQKLSATCEPKLIQLTSLGIQSWRLVKPNP